MFQGGDVSFFENLRAVQLREGRHAGTARFGDIWGLICLNHIEAYCEHTHDLKFSFCRTSTRELHATDRDISLLLWPNLFYKKDLVAEVCCEKRALSLFFSFFSFFFGFDDTGTTIKIYLIVLQTNTFLW